MMASNMGTADHRTTTRVGGNTTKMEGEIDLVSSMQDTVRRER